MRHTKHSHDQKIKPLDAPTCRHQRRKQLFRIRSIVVWNYVFFSGSCAGFLTCHFVFLFFGACAGLILTSQNIDRHQKEKQSNQTTRCTKPAQEAPKPTKTTGLSQEPHSCDEASVPQLEYFSPLQSIHRLNLKISKDSGYIYIYIILYI